MGHQLLKHLVRWGWEQKRTVGGTSVFTFAGFRGENDCKILFYRKIDSTSGDIEDVG